MRIRFEHLDLNTGDDYLSELGNYTSDKTIHIEKRAWKEAGIRYTFGAIVHEFVHYLLDIFHITDDESLAENIERRFLFITGIKRRYWD